MSAPARILLLQLKRIGDTILTAPAVASLRERYPHADIVMVTTAPVAQLAECFAGISQVIAYHDGGINTKVWASLIFGEWDLTLDFTGTDRSAAMAWLSRAPKVVGYARFASDNWRARAYTQLCEASVRELHTVDFHLALAEGKAPSGPSLQLPSVTLPDLPARFALVHIGTAREEKFWPAERWSEVIHALETMHSLPVVLTGTNSGIERPHLDRLRSTVKNQVIDFTGKLSLVQTAAVIAKAKIALGVDSMAMHLAAMFHVPQVVLFGPTNPHHWRPRHDRAITLLAGQTSPLSQTQPREKSAPLELISTQQVISAINSALA
jgi:ADP-heptose:LPS heptosyltransferase